MGIFDGCQNTFWVCLLRSVVELTNLSNSFNLGLGAEGPLMPVPAVSFANSTVYATIIDHFQCPSDRSVRRLAKRALKLSTAYYSAAVYAQQANGHRSPPLASPPPDCHRSRMS